MHNDLEDLINKIIEAEGVLNEIILANKGNIESGNNSLVFSYLKGLQEIKSKLTEHKKINRTIKGKWNNLFGASHRFFEGHPMYLLLCEIDEKLGKCYLVEKTWLDLFGIYIWNKF